MKQEEKTEVLQYLEKFSGVFNEMMQEVVERIFYNQSNPSFSFTEPGKAASVNDLSAMGVPTVKIDPSTFLKQQFDYLERQKVLWQNASKAMMGGELERIIVEEKGDKRFQDGDWDNNPIFSYIKQAYLLNAEYLQDLAKTMEFDDPKIGEQVRFYTRQFVNSMAPTNYVFTNPEVCREILETEGKNLAKGIDNFMRDLENSPQEAFKISQVDINAFKLGKDLAYTPGKVVYENRLIQLIHYAPSTEKTKQVPLLILPPFINKYYILDLDQKKSLVRWLVEQGYSVFLVSWVNPDASLADMNFENYVNEGVIAALNVVQEISGQAKINTCGYCIGGTLLGITQAYLLSKNDKRINSLTFLTTLFDFSEPGEVGNYVSEQMYPLIEQMVDSKGYFDGRVLALSFSLLRENNLFWSFFVENYLKGKDPTPFDILYWNSDSTNIPGKAYLYYLKNMYLENNLLNGEGLSINGQKIDLSSIDTPAYCLAAMADHIVLWQAAYRSAKRLSGDVRFVLTESGHVAGVVNPAAKGKYPHWCNQSLPQSPADWFESSKQVSGSWWNDWVLWLNERSGEDISALSVGAHKAYPGLEDAPGSYVKVRLENAEFAPFAQKAKQKARSSTAEEEQFAEEVD